MTFTRHPYGVEVTLNHPCDRCQHVAQRHPLEKKSVCEMAGCICDGYVTSGLLDEGDWFPSVNGSYIPAKKRSEETA